MDDQENKDSKPTGQNYWDSGFYETGSTRPPKNHGGTLALLLVAGILLVGVINGARALRSPAAESTEDPSAASDPLSLVMTTPPQETQAPENPSLPTTPGGSGSLVLQESPKSVENMPAEGGQSLQAIYEKNIASVVSISCTASGGATSGSGVILSEDGLIVTNAHVVDGATAITVLLSDERTFQAGLVGSDALSDLAVLRIDATDLKAAEFGDSSVLRVGDTVVAIGDPLGVELRGTMTNGIVSAINRDVTTKGRTMTLIQTNAALNSGNSGGPLINCYGQVIGINTMKMSSYVSTSTVEGLGFAIPSTTVKEVVDQLIAQGYVSGRPSLGLDGEDVSVFYQRFYHLPAGLNVTSVDAGSSAHSAGIRTGDILLAVDGERISGSEDLQQILYNHQVGDTVSVIFYQNGAQYTADITLVQAK